MMTLLSIFASSALLGCGPIFPTSYFPSIPYDSTNAVGEVDYRVTPHLGTELAMIGAHYYPAWTGKAPASNRVSTAEADRLDFFAAGHKAGLDDRRITADWDDFLSFTKDLARRLERGETVMLGERIPAYAREFYLYKLGHARWLVFRRDEDPAEFAELLALPAAQRRYRTVWVAFVRLANATTFAEKDAQLAALRAALDDGFEDTAKLEAFVLRFLSYSCDRRYDPLVLTAYRRAPWDLWPEFAKRIFCNHKRQPNFSSDDLAVLCADPIGVEVAIAYGAGARIPPSARRSDHPVLTADRQAWIAFSRGEIDLCRQLLDLASETSLIRLFLESRLARLDGDLRKSERFLHRWLEEYEKKGTAKAEESLVGYSIGSAYLEGTGYWLSGFASSDPDMSNARLFRFGSFGPKDEVYGPYGWEYVAETDPSSNRPNLRRIVAGELGVVKVATRDLEEAFHAFLMARNWIDLAFVAERCLTIDELIRCVAAARVSDADRDVLKGLLSRRLIRAGRLREAVAWANAKMKPLIVEYVDLAEEAARATDSDTRALAYLNLSRLVLARGMELMGTELRPDVSVFEGRYAFDGLPVAEPVEVAARIDHPELAVLWNDWHTPRDRETTRFHYRVKAIRFARAAVRHAVDLDLKAWAMMWGGVAALAANDPLVADEFYKPLARLHHPKARVGTWFTDSDAYWAFRKTYYNDERHCEELRVPVRFTKEQFASSPTSPSSVGN